MIIAAAPGGVTSNILTSFAKGDVALSVSFTAIISLISVVTVPIIVINSAEYFGADVQDISVIAKAILMFMLVTVPLIIGMLLKKFVPNFVLKFEPIAKKISIALFVLVLLGAIAKNREHVIDYFAQAGLITFVLNLAMMIVAYFIAHLLIAGPAQKKCITIECGLQNGTLAIFVANEFFGGGIYVIPAATYSLIMFATSLIFIFFVRKINN